MRIGVPAESLDKYLAAFYPHAAKPQGFENAVSEYAGSIAVLVDGPETVTTFDFMPLLTLCTRVEFKVTFNLWQQQGIYTSQAKFINDLNSLLQSWLIHAEEDHDNDDGGEEEEEEEYDPDSSFPALTHTFVKLYHVPEFSTPKPWRQQPYCHAKIEFVLPKGGSRWWADGKSPHDFREGERWS